MSQLEYKTIAAPQRAAKIRGIKGKDAQFARTIEDMIQAEAGNGWRYLRTDRFPVAEGGGLFSRSTTTERAVLIFVRDLPTATATASTVAAAQPYQAVQPVQPQHTPEPHMAAEPAPIAPNAAPVQEQQMSHPPLGGAVRD